MHAEERQPDAATVTTALTRNQYLVAIIGVMVFAALFSLDSSVRELPIGIYHVFADHTVLWLCVVAALWHIANSPVQQLRASDVITGSAFATAVGLTAGLWPWLFLSTATFLFMKNLDDRVTRQGLYLLLAFGLHEAVVTLCGEMIGDSLLRLDAVIAEFLAGWFLPEISSAGPTLQVDDGPVLVLVWGCSSLSYVGDMMLLCWALGLLLSGNAGMRSRLWLAFMAVALITIVLNTSRLALMAMEPGAYHFFHDGEGAMLFRVITIGATAGVAWLQSRYAVPGQYSPA